ncbi:hypothetical protein [Stenotrophomonas indicatrix]|uniref:hypothetical protein n=1 Tax=Stenotrophomonas indicatrix TaxID=2045451 RepID=UPI0032082482
MIDRIHAVIVAGKGISVAGRAGAHVHSGMPAGARCGQKEKALTGVRAFQLEASSGIEPL